MQPRITNAHEVGDAWRVREVAEAGGRTDRIAPLVHELIAWDLVVRAESGAFVLRDDVQRRLQEASARQGTSTPEVYVGRPCHRCGASGVTRMVDGARLCDACSRVSVVEAEPEGRPSRRHGRHHERWWGHKAG
ncbi:MAG: hypothetical protein ACRDZR_15605 [Acidimicrobiales bacterium]